MKFAKNALIPNEAFSEFVQKNNLDKDSIESFAQELKIDPGIIVGRLQFEGLIPFNRFNEMKTRYTIDA